MNLLQQPCGNQRQKRKPYRIACWRLLDASQTMTRQLNDPMHTVTIHVFPEILNGGIHLYGNRVRCSVATVIHSCAPKKFSVLHSYPLTSLVPRPSPAPFSWPHTWPLNCPEKREKAWYIFYVIKSQGGLNHDVCGLGFSNYGNVPTRQIVIDSKRHKTTPLPF